MECLFCDLNSLTSRLIYKNDTVAAMPTNIPITPGHILVYPVRHISKVDDLNPEELSSIRSLIIGIKKALVLALAAEGFNIAWNEGITAGQSVEHLHIHVVPRRVGDSGINEYEPRKFLYRPGSREVTPESELADVAILVKKNLLC